MDAQSQYEYYIYRQNPHVQYKGIAQCEKIIHLTQSPLEAEQRNLSVDSNVVYNSFQDSTNVLSCLDAQQLSQNNSRCPSAKVLPSRCSIKCSTRSLQQKKKWSKHSQKKANRKSAGKSIDPKREKSKMLPGSYYSNAHFLPRSSIVYLPPPCFDPSHTKPVCKDAVIDVQSLTDTFDPRYVERKPYVLDAKISAQHRESLENIGSSSSLQSKQTKGSSTSRLDNNSMNEALRVLYPSRRLDTERDQLYHEITNGPNYSWTPSLDIREYVSITPMVNTGTSIDDFTEQDTTKRESTNFDSHTFIKRPVTVPDFELSARLSGELLRAKIYNEVLRAISENGPSFKSIGTNTSDCNPVTVQQSTQVVQEDESYGNSYRSVADSSQKCSDDYSHGSSQTPDLNEQYGSPGRYSWPSQYQYDIIPSKIPTSSMVSSPESSKTCEQDFSDQRIYAGYETRSCMQCYPQYRPRSPCRRRSTNLTFGGILATRFIGSKAACNVSASKTSNLASHASQYSSSEEPKKYRTPYHPATRSRVVNSISPRITMETAIQDNMFSHQRVNYDTCEVKVVNSVPNRHKPFIRTMHCKVPVLEVAVTETTPILDAVFTAEKCTTKRQSNGNSLVEEEVYVKPSRGKKTPLERAPQSEVMLLGTKLDKARHTVPSRCVVQPDVYRLFDGTSRYGLNAPTKLYPRPHGVKTLSNVRYNHYSDEHSQTTQTPCSHEVPPINCIYPSPHVLKGHVRKYPTSRVNNIDYPSDRVNESGYNSMSDGRASDRHDTKFKPNELVPRLLSTRYIYFDSTKQNDQFTFHMSPEVHQPNTDTPTPIKKPSKNPDKVPSSSRTKQPTKDKENKRKSGCGCSKKGCRTLERKDCICGTACTLPARANNTSTTMTDAATSVGSTDNFKMVDGSTSTERICHSDTQIVTKKPDEICSSENSYPLSDSEEDITAKKFKNNTKVSTSTSYLKAGSELETYGSAIDTLISWAETESKRRAPTSTIQIFQQNSRKSTPKPSKIKIQNIDSNSDVIQIKQLENLTSRIKCKCSQLDTKSRTPNKSCVSKNVGTEFDINDSTTSDEYNDDDILYDDYIMMKDKLPCTTPKRSPCPKRPNEDGLMDDLIFSSS